jgi:hypothetical protein
MGENERTVRAPDEAEQAELGAETTAALDRAERETGVRCLVWHPATPQARTVRDEDTDTRVAHCAQAENDDPPEDREVQIASRAAQACRHGGRDDSGRRTGR